MLNDDGNIQDYSDAVTRSNSDAKMQKVVRFINDRFPYIFTTREENIPDNRSCGEKLSECIKDTCQTCYSYAKNVGAFFVRQFRKIRSRQEINNIEDIERIRNEYRNM